ncbi:MAG: hypothetical protein KAT56_00425, partial [Sedimentisphaerales bacterium]|nr:hypothetical protein [Sedimentisphaerales bacterium]
MKELRDLAGIYVFLAVICGFVGAFSIVHSALAGPPGENILSLVEIIPLDDFEAFGEFGGPFTPPSKDYQLTYNGEEDYVYCVIEKTADWLDLNPDWVRLDPCVPEIITVSLNETAETMPGGIHNDTLMFTVVDTGDEYTRGVILTIEAPSGILEVTPLEGFEAAGDIGGPFEPTAKEYLLKNVGVAPLFWGIDDPCDWLEWDKTSGILDPCESTTVTVSITEAAELLEEGTYYDTLRLHDLSNDVTYTRSATLSIINIGGIWVEPSSFDEIVIEGTTLTKTLTIGNDGTEDVDYTIQTRVVGGSGDMVGTMAGGADDGDSDFFQASIKHDFTKLGTDLYKPGELIVRFASKAKGQLRSLTEKTDILKSMGGGSIERSFTIVPGLSLVKLPAGLTVEEALVQYNKADGILYAQPNYEVRAISTFPNDTRFNDLWGMHNTGQTGGTPDADIDAPEAWDIATGDSEIIVAVIDTGVDYTHP